MKPILQRPATAQGLFVWVLHRFAEVFEEHAVVKGGIALALHDCPRSTTDIDYVFMPYELTQSSRNTKCSAQKQKKMAMKRKSKKLIENLIPYWQKKVQHNETKTRNTCR